MEINLEVGLKLKSKWFEGITEILAIDEDKNELSVEIYRASGHNHSESWNLQHTIWGFEQGDYVEIPQS